MSDTYKEPKYYKFKFIADFKKVKGKEKVVYVRGKGFRIMDINTYLVCIGAKSNYQ